MITPPLKSKSSIQASSFFNKSASSSSVVAPAATKTTTKESKSSIFSKSASVPAASSQVSTDNNNSQNSTSAAAASTSSQLEIEQEEQEEGEDAEWDDGSGYKVDKSRVAKRELDGGVARRRVIAVDDDDEEETGDKDTTDLTGEAAEGDVESGKKRKAKAALHVHGAMDSYMEDVAIAEYRSSAAAEAAGEALPKAKRTKQKLVEKMFVDAKGYLVTETVMEEVTDDEGDTPSSAAMHIAANKKAAVPVGESQQSTSSSQQTEGADEDLLKASSSSSSAAPKKKAPVAKAAPASKKGDKPAAAPQKGMINFRLPLKVRRRGLEPGTSAAAIENLRLRGWAPLSTQAQSKMFLEEI
eukprot:gene22377-28499_t